MNLVWMVYGVVWVMRLFQTRQVMAAPRFHGADWFVDYRVGVDFYRREGRAMMRQLRMRILAPMAAEAVVGGLLMWRGLWLAALLAQGAAVVVNLFYYAMVLRRIARQAIPFAIVDESAVSKLAVSLEARKVADYSTAWLDWTLRAMIGAGVILLAMAAARPYRDLTRVILIPGIVLYLWAGLILAKRALVAWRITATPAVNPERFREWQETGRRAYIAWCDYVRGMAATFLLCWAVLQAGGHTFAWRLWGFAVPLVAVVLGGMAPVVRRMQRFQDMAHGLKTEIGRWRPGPPLPLEGTFYLEGWVCKEPEEPAVFLRGPNGVALNVGSPRTRIWLAYAAGWLAIAVAAGRARG